ncbi:hypothetical protein [Hansschlegelia plantiphila]|uniref:hypothetical protein n=1 Tax=Hansschlegelia plantiphila TaxID=374655 RepID=UPI0022F2539F|nr:hypothetical protein [Hansschlegelia plantiphila]
MHGQRRLRDSAGFGGASEMTFARKVLEIAELSKGQHAIRLSYFRTGSILFALMEEPEHSARIKRRMIAPPTEGVGGLAKTGVKDGGFS